MTLTPEQTKAFCEAWNVEPLNKWRISSSNPLGNLVAWETTDKEEADYCRHRPSPDFRVDNIYPPLALELLLGVCARSDINVKLRLYWNTAWITELQDVVRHRVKTEAPTPLESLILAMARFKNLNFDLKGE